MDANGDIVLDAEDFEKFWRLVLRPPAPTERLRRAFARTRPRARRDGVITQELMAEVNARTPMQHDDGTEYEPEELIYCVHEEADKAYQCIGGDGTDDDFDARFRKHMVAVVALAAQAIEWLDRNRE